MGTDTPTIRLALFHKSGKQHDARHCLFWIQLSASADPLIPAVAVIALTSTLNFTVEQWKGPHLRKVFRSFTKIDLTRTEQRLTRLYTIQNNIYYCRNYGPEGLVLLLVGPRHLPDDFLRALHYDPTVRHLEFLKTYTGIRNPFYWHGMYPDIFKFCFFCKPNIYRPRQQRWLDDRLTFHMPRLSVRWATVKDTNHRVQSRVNWKARRYTVSTCASVHRNIRAGYVGQKCARGQTGNARADALIALHVPRGFQLACDRN